MLRTMRFLWRNFASVFLLLVGYMAIMMVYAALGGGQEDHDLLWTYYKMSPMVASLLFFFFEMAAGSGWLNMALSTCCTRKRFFLVNQLFLVLSALLVSAILALCVMLPVWMGWDWVDPFLSLSELPFFFCSTVAVGELAHVLGLFYLDYPRLGLLCTTLGILLWLFVTVWNTLSALGVFSPPPLPLSGLILGALCIAGALGSARITSSAAVR